MAAGTGRGPNMLITTVPGSLPSRAQDDTPLVLGPIPT